jgi:hypothetical protein
MCKRFMDYLVSKSLGQEHGSRRAEFGKLACLADGKGRAIACRRDVATTEKESLGRGGQQENLANAVRTRKSLSMFHERRAKAAASLIGSNDQGSKQRIAATQLKSDETRGR